MSNTLKHLYALRLLGNRSTAIHIDPDALPERSA
ncbi:hypothetical protein HDC36_004633 [Xanthomonas sp. JAI131]|jgi:hypothetical protein|nr:hypothetical protein [Xanthomonas sp. JAI131]